MQETQSIAPFNFLTNFKIIQQTISYCLGNIFNVCQNNQYTQILSYLKDTEIHRRMHTDVHMLMHIQYIEVDLIKIAHKDQHTSTQYTSYHHEKRIAIKYKLYTFVYDKQFNMFVFHVFYTYFTNVYTHSSNTPSIWRI